jgi:LuxR family quorum sensing-dependent transcriptional regulator
MEDKMLGQGAGHWGIKALDFVDALEAVRNATEATDLLRKTIAEAGFSAFVMCGLPDATTDFRNRMIADGWPPGWASLYVAEGFAHDDPVERHCLRTVEPFSWNEAPYSPANEPRAHEVMTRATDFRMRQGFCIPIHYGDGSGAAVSFAGERPEMAPHIRAAMHLVALYAHHKVRGLVRPAQPLGRVLSAREREVLNWAKGGKTDWEISIILNISERTARAHMQSAARKLHAVNRTSTIVNALRRGEIKL